MNTAVLRLKLFFGGGYLSALTLRLVGKAVTPYLKYVVYFSLSFGMYTA